VVFACLHVGRMNHREGIPQQEMVVVFTLDQEPGETRLKTCFHDAECDP
jgi:hypothetical protein